MTKKIEIEFKKGPIEPGTINFPDKCVYCGAPKNHTMPKEITGFYVYKDTKGGFKRNTRHLGEVDVPYCETHFQELKAFDAKGVKRFGKLSIPLYALSLLIVLLILFRPIYNWGIEVMIHKLGGILGPIATGFSTIIICAMIAGLLWFAFVALIEKVIFLKEKPPYGLEINADTNGTHQIIFEFQNNTTAKDFLELNKDIDAHEYVKKSLKEITGALKESMKEGMKESREAYKKKKR